MAPPSASFAPRLATPRLELRLARPDEANLVLDYARRNAEHLAPWEPTPPPASDTEAFWRERLEQAAEESSRGRHIRFHLFESNAPTARVLGAIGLSNIVRGVFECAYLGFSLDGARQGEGLMREALEAVIGFAWAPLNLHRIEANYQPHNVRSGALLRRLGFQPTGFARDYLFIAGAWRDHVQTAILNPAWVAPR
jgi:[ribosomal protein S5]-alanine N-acetyltransferase